MISLSELFYFYNPVSNKDKKAKAPKRNYKETTRGTEELGGEK